MLRYLRLHTYARVVPYCPAVTPPLFATYFQEKEGGGRNNEDLHFRLAVKPPPLPPTNFHTGINEALLCGRRQDRHAMAVLKDGRVVGHIHVAIL